MKRTERLAGLVGLLMLVAFFAPYIVKLPQIDITLILLGGVALSVYDYLTSQS